MHLAVEPLIRPCSSTFTSARLDTSFRCFIPPACRSLRIEFLVVSCLKRNNPGLYAFLCRFGFLCNSFLLIAVTSAHYYTRSSANSFCSPQFFEQPFHLFPFSRSCWKRGPDNFLSARRGTPSAKWFILVFLFSFLTQNAASAQG